MKKITKIAILPKPCSTYVELQLFDAFWHIFTLFDWQELCLSFRMKYFWAFFLTFRTIFRAIWKWSKIDFWAFCLVKPEPKGRFRPFFTPKMAKKALFWCQNSMKNFLSKIDPKSRGHAELHLLNVVSFQNFPKWAIFAILAQFIEKKKPSF